MKTKEQLEKEFDEKFLSSFEHYKEQIKLGDLAIPVKANDMKSFLSSTRIEDVEMLEEWAENNFVTWQIDHERYEPDPVKRMAYNEALRDLLSHLSLIKKSL